MSFNENIYPPHPLNKVKSNRYESLDGLRAYAAIGIVMMHVLANIAVKPSGNFLTDAVIPYFMRIRSWRSDSRIKN